MRPQVMWVIKVNQCAAPFHDADEKKEFFAPIIGWTRRDTIQAFNEQGGFDYKKLRRKGRIKAVKVVLQEVVA